MRPATESPAALRDYAFIADGYRGALVGPGGDLAWLCVPRWESPAVFATLIGAQGTYSVHPHERCVWGGYYEDRSLMWRSRWTTSTGFVESRDALAYPGEPGRAVVLRRICAMDAPARVEVVLDPATGYGHHRPVDWQLHEGVWTAHSHDLWVRWHGGGHATVERALHGRGHRLALALRLEAGQQHDLVLELSSRPLDDQEPPDPDRAWEMTRSAWRAAVPSFETTVATRDVRHSYAVLTGMTPPGGGTVAAATTSLPERARAGRNYDYRYSWVRDLCYVGLAAGRVAQEGALFDGAVSWVASRLLADGKDLHPAYTSKGAEVPDEQTLDLAGYPGGQDVVGNRVRHQFQLDIFGESLELLATAARVGRLDADGWRAADLAAEAIASRWEESDAGIWELDPRRWTHSQLVCVGGLRAICGAGAPVDWSARYLPLADGIMASVSRTCLHHTGRWQRAADDQRVDASLLLAEIRRIVPASDTRSQATRRAVAEELTRHGFVYRFRHDGAPLEDAEGAFLIGNFWMSLACLQAGHLVDAVRWFERARGATSTTGLFSEEFDVGQRQLRGNIPQAFVHALAIEAAAAQSDAGCGWDAGRDLAPTGTAAAPQSPVVGRAAAG